MREIPEIGKFSNGLTKAHSLLSEFKIFILFQSLDKAFYRGFVFFLDFWLNRLRLSFVLYGKKTNKL